MSLISKNNYIKNIEKTIGETKKVVSSEIDKIKDSQYVDKIDNEFKKYANKVEDGIEEYVDILNLDTKEEKNNDNSDGKSLSGFISEQMQNIGKKTKDVGEQIQNVNKRRNFTFYYDDYDYFYGDTVTYDEKVDNSLEDDELLDSYISQGMTNAGDYSIYAFIKKDGDKEVGTAIRIIDKDGNIVKTLITDDVDLLGHANDLEYDESTGKVYVATMDKDAPLKSFDLLEAINSNSNELDDLKINDESDLFNISDLNNLSGFTIDESTGIYYFASGHTIKAVKDGKVIQVIKKQEDKDEDNSHESQGIFAKDGKLYVIRYNRNSDHSNGGIDVDADSSSASANMIDVYENGSYSNTISIKSPTYEDENGERIIGELESISYDKETEKYTANFYYKTVSYDDSSRSYSTVVLDM